MSKQFLVLFAGTFFISLFVLMMQFLWRYVDDLIGKGLSLEVLGQFFWYMGLGLVPQALPLAILLASLITMGNLGENSELTAIKAAGISLVQMLRSLFFLSVLVMCASFYFQDVVAPMAQQKMAQLLVSMKQKSPELEIPEGIFYDGIPDCNLYVQHKDIETGKLYGLMIYKINGSFEDAAVILADSGMLQSTADKQHLLLTLWGGEWFENMKSQELVGNANVPYRRESFLTKRIVLDFDDGFNLADGSLFSGNAKTKSLKMLREGIDSLNLELDTVGRDVKSILMNMTFDLRGLNKKDTLNALAKANAGKVNFDSVLAKAPVQDKRDALQTSLSRMQMENTNMELYAMPVADYEKQIREHWIEAVNKFTLSLTCLIFFFIGASLGAIIRKGGLGVPVIISVLVFIVFYTLDNTGYRMARLGAWPIWLGKGLAPGVLIPFAVFVTIKANKDSAVFNMDAYRNAFMKLFGLRLKRHIDYKEVVLSAPLYREDVLALQEVTEDSKRYSEEHHLVKLPNIIKVFFDYQEDHEIQRITEKLETVIDDLSNTRDRYIMDYINRYPIVSERAHTRPFDRKWMNIAAFIIVPLGLFLYCRMWTFRLRLYHDLKQIVSVNDMIAKRVETMTK